jgi:hypothetical protein
MKNEYLIIRFIFLRRGENGRSGKFELDNFIYGYFQLKSVNLCSKTLQWFRERGKMDLILEIV